MTKFYTVTWRPDDPQSIASALRVVADSLETNPPELERGPGFDSPVGTPEERLGAKVWPGHWVDALPYGTKYFLGYHTGADLNLNEPTWDLDRDSPVYAMSDGLVTYAGFTGQSWRNLVIIKHDALPDGVVAFGRYAHVHNLLVKANQRVERGQQISTTGYSGQKNEAGQWVPGPYHLHLDISLTTILETNPAHWPGGDLAALRQHYVSPREFIATHRPPLL